ncbi:unnamed protein product [Caenorhabditis bovis]|uniref:MEIS N-terminal domain-containing protein n=1 Tax=Caenorhabditis bovis TaxID=2654633 RepID=A0A8S1EDA8_9PELO|nr:unnamed protein product [Caenorhabditis bovis]
MRKAILALRTCLVELQRVHSLSDKFKERYLAVLRRTVCHEALIGNTADSDDDITDNNTSDAVEGSTVATIQTNNGTLSFPLQINQQSITMVPSTSQFEANLEFLRKIGIQAMLTPQVVADASKKIVGSPEKSEEEKTIAL